MVDNNIRYDLTNLAMSSLLGELGNLVDRLDEKGRDRGFIFKVVDLTKFGCLFSISREKVEVARGSIHLSYERTLRDIWVGLPQSTDLRHFSEFSGLQLVIVFDKKFSNYILLQLISLAKLRPFGKQRGAGLSFTVSYKDGAYKVGSGLNLIDVKPIGEEAEFAEKLYDFLRNASQ